jgi:hypothetical protein
MDWPRPTKRERPAEGIGRHYRSQTFARINPTEPSAIQSQPREEPKPDYLHATDALLPNTAETVVSDDDGLPELTSQMKHQEEYGAELRIDHGHLSDLAQHHAAANLPPTIPTGKSSDPGVSKPDSIQKRPHNRIKLTMRFNHGTRIDFRCSNSDCHWIEESGVEI